MHDMKEKITDICDMKKRLTSFVQAKMEMGLESIDAQDATVLGELVDMIKDFSEIEKNCYEACYYKSVIEAMDEYDDYDDNERAGYPKRDRMGRFSPNRSQTGRDVRTSSNERMGYIPDPRVDWHWKDDRMDDPDKERYGKPFSEYRMAKRNYTETHSEKDKQKMHDSANEHMMSSIATIREIWDTADPELRNRMKADMQKLVNELN